MENLPSSTHPMIVVAATTVTIASLTAIAYFVGWIPLKAENAAAPVAQGAVAPATAPVVVPASVATPVAVPEAKPVAPEKIAPVRKAAPRKAPKEADHIYESAPPTTSNRGSMPVSQMNDSSVVVENNRQQPQYGQNANPCRDCATVESVREVKQEGEGSGLGAISGGVVGGLLGNQIGGGRGKTVGAVVGAVGGAFAGNAVEKNVRSTKHYEITVRIDDGNTRIFTESQPPSLQQGDRVRISNGQLVRM